MTKEEIKSTIQSAREKLDLLEKKSFSEEKGKHPFTKIKIDYYRKDLDFLEDNIDKDLTDDQLELFTELLKSIDEEANLDLPEFIKSNALDTPAGELLAALQQVSLDNEEKLSEEDKKVEIPPVENIIGVAEAEAPAEEVHTEEPVNELDTINTEDIINSLDEEPKEEFEPIPEDLANEMINAANEAEANNVEAPAEDIPLVEEEVPEVESIPLEDIAQPENITNAVEAAPEVETVPEEVVAEAPVEEAPVAEPVQEIANVPTQDVDVAAIDNILNTLDEPTEEVITTEPVAEAPVAAPEVAPVVEAPAEPVAAPVDVPPMEEAVATPEVAPVVEAPAEPVVAPVDVPPMEEAVAAPEVATPVVETPAAEEVIAAPEPAPAMDVPVAEPVAAPSPIIEQAVEQVVQEVAQDVVAAPAMPEVAPIAPEAPVAPEMVAPAAPVVEGPTLTLNM